MWFIVVLAVIVFLLMEHPIAFWLIFVPLGLLFLFTLLSPMTGRRINFLDLFAPMLILIIIIIVLLLIV